LPRLKLVVAYEGTDFAGWQFQPEQRTVQGELERALSSICGRDVRVHGAGRTDAGVHALGQVAHCDVPERRAGVDWPRALSSMLPDDLAVLAAEPAAQDFHARKHALSKTYVYSLAVERRYDLPQRRRFAWATGPLDKTAMKRAAAHLVGRRDFAGFMNLGTPVHSTVRALELAEGRAGTFPGEVDWVFKADGFLKQMVRNMVGLLAEVGRGKLDPDRVPQVLALADRDKAPYATAPAHGLCLARVAYPERT